MLKTYEEFKDKGLKIRIKPQKDKSILSEYALIVERHKNTSKRDSQFILSTRLFMLCGLVVVLAAWLLFAIFIIF